LAKGKEVKRMEKKMVRALRRAQAGIVRTPTPKEESDEKVQTL
jgi:hypothetical protein